MADRPSARDEDRLPWLDSVEGERARGRKPVPRGVLVGLLVAFFGIGLAVAFSLGYRIAQPEAPAPTSAGPSQQTATVQVPLAPPVPTPKVELVVPEPVIAQPPESKPAVAARPAANKAHVVRHKAKPRHVRHAKRKPILRPFINVKRPPPKPAAPPRSPYAGPAGKLIQLGAYSTQKQADRAWRSITWRYPYLAKKPRVVAMTPPIGGYRYYRLRLATDSQAQSAVICQYLQARRQSCIILY